MVLCFWFLFTVYQRTQTSEIDCSLPSWPLAPLDDAGKSTQMSVGPPPSSFETDDRDASAIAA